MSDRDFLARAVELASKLTHDAGPDVGKEPGTAPFDPLHRTAALVGSYTVEELRDKSRSLGLAGAEDSDPLESMDALLGSSIPTSRERGKAQRWLLSSDVRGAVLKEMADDGSLRQGLGRLGDDEGDPLIRLLADQAKKGKSRPAARYDIDELQYALKLTEWLSGTKDFGGLPPPEDIARLLHRAELLRPFRTLVAHFQGRADALRALRTYVDALPSESTLEAVSRGVGSLYRAYFDIEEKPPLMIHGLGGIGKTSVVGKFLVDHVERTKSEELAFAYIDFDRPGFTIEEPLTILVEAVRQLALYYPQHEPELDELRELWDERLVRAQRDASTSSLNEVITSSSTAERDVYLREFEEIWQRMELDSVPFLVVLDSFEEVHRGDDLRLRKFFDFLQEWSKAVPRLRAVLVGRSRPAEIPTEPLKIGPFDEESAIGYLASRKIRDGEAAAFIYRVVGGTPLNLQLGAEVVLRTAEEIGIPGDVSAATVRKAFKDLRTREKLFFRMKDELIQKVLFERNLEHIRDDDVRKLAFPGLLLRRIDTGVLRHVLADPCGLGEVDDDRARALLEKLAAETFLIEDTLEDGLRYRPDLRKLLLPWIESTERVEGRKIHDLAVQHYLTIDKDYARAEVVYHRLKRGDDPRDLPSFEWTELNRFLEGSLDELPPTAAVFIAGKLGIDVPEDLLAKADADVQLCQLAEKARRVLVNGTVEDLQEMAAELSGREGRETHGALLRAEATLRARLGDDGSAEDIAEAALRTPVMDETATEHEPALRLLLAQLAERRYDYASALERYEAASSAAENAGLGALALPAWLGSYRALHRLELEWGAFNARRTSILQRLADLMNTSGATGLDRGFRSIQHQLPPFPRRTLEELIEASAPVDETELMLAFGGSWFVRTSRFEEGYRNLSRIVGSLTDLENLVMENLEIALREITAPGALAPVCFDVLIFAEAAGKIDGSVIARAGKARPGRPRRWDEVEFNDAVTEAVEAFDRSAVERLCRELVHHLRSRPRPYPEEFAEKILNILRRKRHFDLMAEMGDAFLRAGQTAPKIQRLYAMSLLDARQISAALAILREIERAEGVSPLELAEARGLIGRAYKQIYVDSGDPTVPNTRAQLFRAIDAYHDIYVKDPDNLWPGINAASLLARAERDGLDRAGRPAPEVIARAIVDVVDQRRNTRRATIWNLATAAEACAILGRFDKAAAYLKEYVSDPAADAFELASTLRQFEEVLELDRCNHTEAVLLDLLREGLLRRSGGFVDTAAVMLFARNQTGDDDLIALDAVGDDPDFRSVSWLDTGLRRASAVATIWSGRRPIGTGFLLPGSLLSKKWRKRQVFVTTNHVLSTGRNVRASVGIPPESASVTFAALQAVGQRELAIQEVLYESPIEELDITCCLLDTRVDGVDDYHAANLKPSGLEANRILTIGQRLEGEQSFSIVDAKLVDIGGERIHYRSATETPSSGSPLFNEDWALIGIHHAHSREMRRLDDRDGFYEASEGILWPAIKKAVQSTIG